MHIVTQAIFAIGTVTMMSVAAFASPEGPQQGASNGSGSNLVKVVPADAQNAGRNVTIRVESNQTAGSSQQVYLDNTKNRPTDAVIICRKTETLGSRLRSKRMCLSAAQWKTISDRARDNVTAAQNKDAGGSCLPGSSGC